MRKRYTLFESTRGQEWMGRAKCKDKADAHEFFSSGGPGQRAKDYCTGDTGEMPCPVLGLCRRFSIVNHEEFGIWGGLDPDDRRRARGVTVWPGA
jgi:WhiB family redox-sensing transcriptional regulator